MRHDTRGAMRSRRQYRRQFGRTARRVGKAAARDLVRKLAYAGGVVLDVELLAHALAKAWADDTRHQVARILHGDRAIEEPRGLIGRNCAISQSASAAAGDAAGR